MVFQFFFRLVLLFVRSPFWWYCLTVVLFSMLERTISEIEFNFGVCFVLLPLLFKIFFLFHPLFARTHACLLTHCYNHWFGSNEISRLNQRLNNLFVIYFIFARYWQLNERRKNVEKKTKKKLQ